jgi:hypothetical protein
MKQERRLLIGMLHGRTGRFSDAMLVHREALALARKSVDPGEIARSLRLLGVLHRVASIGVATCTAPYPPHIDPLLAAADDALYRAKHAGRNRVGHACSLRAAHRSGRATDRAGHTSGRPGSRRMTRGRTSTDQTRY